LLQLRPLGKTFTLLVEAILRFSDEVEVTDENDED